MKKLGPEHVKTRLPLIDKLVNLGWKKDQLLFEPEWLIPKTPSEASKRELGQKFKGYPVDVVIFDDSQNLGQWENVQIIIETKCPNKKEGLNQLEIYLSLETRTIVGFWTNGDETVALYRTPDGTFRKQLNAKLPAPGDNIILPTEDPITWNDLQIVDGKFLTRTFQRLLDHTVANDSKSTRRDDQLNQLCNLLLIKLESDKKAKSKPKQPVVFQIWGDEDKTFKQVKSFFDTIKLTHNDLFASLVDKEINLDPSTVQKVCFELSSVRLVDIDIDVLSTAFQIFRTATLKSEEGQYFTPPSVIRSAVKIMDIDYDDKIIDPACGSGGFLLECFKQFKDKFPTIDSAESKAWAQKHLYGIDKDEINIKLTKAMMMILGDGSAHTFIGDSLREHLWAKKWPHLVTALGEESYTCIITNPPFGKNLKLSSLDARYSQISISKEMTVLGNGTLLMNDSKFQERELGIVFLERCFKILITGGRLGIILPETYFFSKSYEWLPFWLKERFILRGMFNIPMEAFQGFCRAKTNFYVFEKK